MSKIELTGEETNADLQTMCDEFSITVEAKSKKPNKTELITAIEAYNAATEPQSEDSVDDEEEEPVNEGISEDEYKELMNDTVTEEAPAAPKKKTGLTRREQKDLLFKLRRVQVSANDETQSKRDVKFITWGNDVIGHQTDRLLMGRPWHIREGALRNIKDKVITKSVPHPETGNPEFVEMPAYNIIELPMLTIDEYKDLGKKQAIRDAAVNAAAM